MTQVGPVSSHEPFEQKQKAGVSFKAQEGVGVRVLPEPTHQAGAWILPAPREPGSGFFPQHGRQRPHFGVSPEQGACGASGTSLPQSSIWACSRWLQTRKL